MKIKKADDKPMVLHTKQKSKIHSHEPKNIAIKGNGTGTVERIPKTKGVAVIAAKVRTGALEYMKKSSRKTYYKATASRIENSRERGVTKFRKSVKEANQSIKAKNSNLHIAGRAGAKAVTDQMEGGQEIQQAAYLAHEVTRPLTRTTSKSTELLKRQAIEVKKRRFKKVEAGKKLAKKSVHKTAKDTVKGSTKKAAKETAKKASKIAVKTATTATTTAAGSLGGPAGIAIGMAAGYAAGVAVEAKDTQITNRNRKIKFFLDKMKAQENQQDSAMKLIKDLITRKAVLWVKTVAPVVGSVLLLLVLVVAMISIPVVAVIGVLYNSPFALFLPPLKAGDTVQSVTSAYVSEFNQDVNTLANNHKGYDEGRIVYVNYEGVDANPSNYYYILAVYMVKYGIGDTATVMNDTSKGWIQAVVDDMCSYTTSTESKTEEVDNGDGTTRTVTTTCLCVNVSLKSYRDMISVYGFDSDEVEMLEQIMSPEYLKMLGWSGGGGDLGVSSLTETQINAILSRITNVTQKKVCSYALHKVGYPYSQDMRDSSSYYDCSSLAYYSWGNAGVDISFQGATTAAAEGQRLDEAGKTVSYDELQPGDLIFYSYTSNGRYKNISHVAVYVESGKVVEARSEEYGVVYRDVPNTGSIVLIGRP